MRRSTHDEKGMGLIMAVALLTVVALGIGLMAPVVFQVAAADNSARTASSLEALKIALAGNPRLVAGGARADFGYLGTMGTVPPQLSSLWLKGAQPSYAFDIPKKTGAGWIGPYPPTTFMSDLLALDADPYGNLLVYTSTPFIRPSDGQTVAARIRSVGADGTADTGDDQLIDILKAEAFSTVTGTLRRGSNPVKFATVTLNYPLNGVLSQAFDVTDADGVFEFLDVSFGTRSISIDPKLTYEEGSADVQGNDTVRFTITNYATNDILITSITPTHNVAGFYQEIRIGNTNVFDYQDPPYNGTRAASGQTITFTGVTVKGSGKPTQVVPIRVDKAVTVTPDLLIKGIGKSAVVRLEDFRSTQTGSGSNVNPSGGTFTITFSDGSQNVFTVP